MDKQVMFSSDRHDWETPQQLFAELNSEFMFTLDAAADKKNSKCVKFFSAADDTLHNEWYGRVFCNPPYGKDIPKFVQKAVEEIQQPYCELIVLLIPARTDTKYWHEHIFNVADEIRFLKGRLKFETGGVPAAAPAPFPSAIIIYRNRQLFLKEETA